MTVVSKKEADAHDRIMEAAAELAELIELAPIRIGENALEKLTIYLAENAAAVKDILKLLKGQT
ncbi:MAG: YebG family protein [Proteobacteria bacterium]|nr:YebG family protein [Pseudomonadota bacterium]